MTVKSGREADVRDITSILAANSEDSGLFQKPESLILATLSDWLAARDIEGRVVGCASLHRDSARLGEIRGVAVQPEFQGKGIGGASMRECQRRGAAQSRSNPHAIIRFRLRFVRSRLSYFHDFLQRRIRARACKSTENQRNLEIIDPR
jgi:GNAT superfamily N-acetyltransferase